MSKERVTLAELAEQMRELREGLFALRADLREALNAAETLAQRREKKAARQARWRASNGPNNAANVDATKTLVASTERKEGEERNLPPTPPIKREEGERKGETRPDTRARAREDDPMNFTPPYAPADNDPRTDDGDKLRPITFKQLCDMARIRYKCTDEAFLREVYEVFQASGWRDRHNEPMNPGMMLYKFIKNRKRIDELRKVETPNGKQPFVGRRPDNWIDRQLKEEDCVLG